MTFVAVPNTCRAELRMTQRGQQIENRFHVEKATPYVLSDFIALGALMSNWWTDSIATLVTVELQLNSIVFKALDSEIATGYEYPVSPPVSGVGTDGDLPMNVTLAVKLLTALSGRSYRGRLYHPGLMPTGIEGSRMLDAARIAIVAGYEQLRSLLIADDQQWVIVSYVAAGAPRVSPVTTAVTGLTADADLDSQRRRLPGRGI